MSDIVKTPAEMESVQWLPAPFPGAEIKLLANDEASGSNAFLIKLDPGVELAAHKHPSVEQNWVLDGEIECQGKVLGPGSFMFCPAGTEHGPFKSVNGGTMLCFFSGPVGL